MDLLPLGSIVILKESRQKLIIVGRFHKNIGDNKIYDYAAYYYPEGLKYSKINYLFNNKDIEEVVFKGYTDKEDENFLIKIKK